MARKILLADDSVTAQNMGRKILTDAGYDVITVNNGSAALKRVAEQKPDLIVLDVYMPGYSGLEVCVRLKDAPETARIPILLTVGKLEPFKPEEATRVRADGFIVKPFEASELLSALTRLEDRMVPSQSEGGRFGAPSSGIERFSGGDPSVRQSEGDDSDGGWKNRLRFPSKKKKEETEPEPEPDFVTPSSFRDFRRGGGKSSPGSPPFPLSTAPAAAAQVVVPDIPRDITPEELDALSELAAKLDGAPAPEKTAPASEKANPEFVAAPVEPASEAPETVVQETVQQTVQETNVEDSVAAAPAEVKSESETAVSGQTVNAEAVEMGHAEPPVETPPAVETAAAEPVVYKTEAALAQEPAPIDRDDEPVFASAKGAADAPSESPSQAEPPAASMAELEVVPPASEQSVQAEEPQSVEPAPAEELSTRVAAHIPETIAAAQGSSPSAEELAEALRFLTPSQPPSSLAEAGAALADELARGAGSRWIAEAVALSPGEASGSLEAEMFRTFAPAASDQPPSPEVPATSVAASETSVAVSEPVQEIAAAPASPEFSPAAEAIEQPSTPQQAETEQAESREVPAPEAEEPVAATTFADAVRDQEVESAAETAGNGEAEAATHVHEAVAVSENGPEDEGDMAKETKGKNGKSTWHQIRPGVPAPASDAVETAKKSEEEAKTMAAAASADTSSDARNIANIVDSVLADLRPKIVEEIAKQLAKK